MRRCAVAILIVFLLTGCARTAAPPAPAAVAPPPPPPALPVLDDLRGIALTMDMAHQAEVPPPLRVENPDQREVIVRVLEMLNAAKPVAVEANRYAGTSAVLQLYLKQGGGVSVFPAYDCASFPESGPPTGCVPVAGQVTYMPPNNAKPVRLQSPELLAWLESGWKSNWPQAKPPEKATVQITVREGDDPAITPIGGATVTFESETGFRQQVQTRPDGTAEVVIPTIPVISDAGQKRCVAYTVTVTAPSYKTEVIEPVLFSPWSDGSNMPIAVLKGEGTWHMQEHEKCLPDQEPGL